jgi:predicted MFS family arabinose efflux permease
VQVGSIYIAGEAVGALMQILIADKLGRIRFMQLAAIIVTIGATIQTASQNLGMFLAGRIISGIAVGSVLNPTSFGRFFFFNTN